jgi:hypothetical protein
MFVASLKMLPYIADIRDQGNQGTEVGDQKTEVR